MQIFLIKDLYDIKKYNKHYKFDLGNYHCIYFDRTIKNNKLLKEFKLNILLPEDIHFDKTKFKSNYVQFIGDLSAYFPTKYWWATQTAAKFRSPLIFCLYKLRLILNIIEHYPVDKLIIIDNSYSFEKAIYYYAKNNHIELLSLFSKYSKYYYKIKFHFLFYYKIIRSLLGLIFKIYLSKYLFQKKLKQNNLKKPILALKTFAYESSFNHHHQFVDKFFGKLPTYLENQRNEILSIVTCLGDYRKILYNIVKDKKNLIFPIELFISPVDLIKNFLNIIKLQFKVNQTIYFDHIDLTQFINDYFLINKANEISLNHVLEYDSIKGLLKYFSIKSFIATYENIPWEPMCFLALKETSPETMSIGYQHSNVSDFDTNYFLSGYELSKRPLPDRIYTVGPITKNIIEKNSGGQYPYIESTCALRYKYLHYGIKNFRNNNKKIWPKTI